jgi:hypothetical protein
MHKGIVVPLRSIEAHLGDRRYSSYSFLTSALEGDEITVNNTGINVGVEETTTVYFRVSYIR